jgi:hypothetical protein
MTRTGIYIVFVHGAGVRAYEETTTDGHYYAFCTCALMSRESLGCWRWGRTAALQDHLIFSYSANQPGVRSARPYIEVINNTMSGGLFLLCRVTAAIVGLTVFAFRLQSGRAIALR